ncbi:MAG: hypothetical protein ACXW19_01360, partial [Thermoanaerobaculia bacterium]
MSFHSSYESPVNRVYGNGWARLRQTGQGTRMDQGCSRFDKVLNTRPGAAARWLRAIRACAATPLISPASSVAKREAHLASRKKGSMGFFWFVVIGAVAGWYTGRRGVEG